MPSTHSSTRARAAEPSQLRSLDLLVAAFALLCLLAAAAGSLS
jgi:hypothetical protein